MEKPGRKERAGYGGKCEGTKYVGREWGKVEDKLTWASGPNVVTHLQLSTFLHVS